MTRKIDIIALMRFGREMDNLRLIFPEFALEIDRCFYDVGQNHAVCCSKKDCACRISFEDFHKQRNENFQSEVKK